MAERLVMDGGAVGDGTGNAFDGGGQQRLFAFDLQEWSPRISWKKVLEGRAFRSAVPCGWGRSFSLRLMAEKAGPLCGQDFWGKTCFPVRKPDTLKVVVVGAVESVEKSGDPHNGWIFGVEIFPKTLWKKNWPLWTTRVFNTNCGKPMLIVEKTVENGENWRTFSTACFRGFFTPVFRCGCSS